ncbi:hypothetical protein D3C86_1355170 [compost metagenome]
MKYLVVLVVGVKETYPEPLAPPSMVNSYPIALVPPVETDPYTRIELCVLLSRYKSTLIAIHSPPF